MRKLGIILFFIAGIFLLIPSVHGQDVIYSQQFSQPMYYNPAFTGINTGVRARFSYRDQWPNLPVDFKSYCFSADVGDRGLPGSGGFGLLVNSTNDGIGLIKYVSVGLNMAVRVPISSLMVAQVGIKAAVVQKKVNWDDMVFADQLSERYG
ncbi:MAG: type IX secretion system membrane protein PorP/SprF, partial [Bacteroidota bacterium]|nr:type IX secretion system membrane protein PorP/SprF [Bacteroidota bacterium]